MTSIQPDSKLLSPWIAVVKLLRWDKPEGRLILMIPALWAIFLAGRGLPPLPLVGIIVAGSLATSAAGCVVNDLWDRDIDPQVVRTRTRPLAAKALTVKVGIGVAIVAFCCAFVLALYLTPLSFWLCVAAVPVIVLYPLAKRFFPVPQLVLAIAWGFAVLISWSAVNGQLEPATWWLWGATLCWTLGFDTIYAMPDREDDRRLGVNSSALFFGESVPLAIAICLLGTLLLLIGLGVTLELNLGFWLSLGISASVWASQYLRLRQPQPDAVLYGKLFRQQVGVGFLLLVGMISGCLL